MQSLRPLLGSRRQGQIDRATACFESHSNRLLADDDVREALALLSRGTSVSLVAARFGVSKWCIYNLRLGRTHTRLVAPQG